MLLEDLKKIELHDQGLELIKFDFLSKKIEFIISVYNEKKSDYDYLEMSFSDVSNLSISKIDLNDFSSMEIYSHEVKEYMNKPWIKFVLLVGVGKPSVELSFSFTEFNGTSVDPME